MYIPVTEPADRFREYKREYIRFSLLHNLIEFNDTQFLRNYCFLAGNRYSRSALNNFDQRYFFENFVQLKKSFRYGWPCLTFVSLSSAEYI